MSFRNVHLSIQAHFVLKFIRELKTLSRPLIVLLLMFIVLPGLTKGQVLSAYSPLTMSIGKDTSVSPLSLPSNTVKISVFGSGNFSGVLTARASTGVITITNAKPAGNYVITVKAFSSSGNSTSQSFNLTVNNTECSDGRFNGNTTIPVVRPNLTGLAVGDFNGDGNQDLAAAHVGYNSVEVSLGNGSGGFSPTTEIGATSHPYALVVGDFDRDGKQDLAIACEGANLIAIRIGDGNGGFGVYSNIPVGQSPIGIALGDFNNDGKQDIVTANYIDHNLSIRLGDGAGGFTAASSVSVGSYPESVAVGDFNNDGKQDLAIANRGSDNVSIRLGNGLGGFSPKPDIPVGYSPSSLVIDDFNRDGNQDFAVSNHASNTISVRYGTGTGTFTGNTEVPVGNGPYCLAAGNFNGDEFTDLVVTNYFGNTVSARFGDGAGGFTGNGLFPVGTYPTGIVTGEFNSDKRMDLAIANYYDHTISVRYGMNGIPTPNPLSSNSPVCEGQRLRLYSYGGKSYSWSGPGGFSSTLQNPEINPVSLSHHGVFALTMTDMNNCSATSTTMVNVNPLPVVSFTLPSDSLCVFDHPMPLSGGLPAGGVYLGPGVTNSAFNPGVAGTGGHNLYYSYTDSNECTNTATDKMTVLICAETPEVSDENDFTVYPNPATGAITVEAPKLNGKDHSLTLFNSQGSVLAEWLLTENHRHEFSLGDFPAGIYILRLNGKKAQSFTRIVKLE